MQQGTEFSRLMQDAVAIKSAQLSKLRKKFDSWPQFHQAGLYYCESFKDFRLDSLEKKLQLFQAKKAEGSDFVNSGEFQKALHRYEEALTVFRWVENANPNWRNSGIEDSDLTLKLEEKTPEVTECMVTAYLNIAYCNIKLQIWKEALQACDEALKLSPNHVKALYRKSLALTLPAGSDIDDYKQAVTLLSTALKLDPQNKTVRAKLTEYKHFIKEQQIKSKQTFKSFFRKSTYSNPQPQAKQNPSQEINALIHQAEVMVKDLKAQEKHKEAKSLRKKLKQMKDFKKQAKQKQVAFEKTQKLKEEAQKYGLDLDDPEVRSQIKKLCEAKPAKTSKWKFYALGALVGLLVFCYNFFQLNYSNLR